MVIFAIDLLLLVFGNSHFKGTLFWTWKQPTVRKCWVANRVKFSILVRLLSSFFWCALLSLSLASCFPFLCFFLFLLLGWRFVVVGLVVIILCLCLSSSTIFQIMKMDIEPSDFPCAFSVSSLRFLLLVQAVCGVCFLVFLFDFPPILFCVLLFFCQAERAVSGFSGSALSSFSGLFPAFHLLSAISFRLGWWDSKSHFKIPALFSLSDCWLSFLTVLFFAWRHGPAGNNGLYAPLTFLSFASLFAFPFLPCFCTSAEGLGTHRSRIKIEDSSSLSQDDFPAAAWHSFTHHSLGL